MIAACVDVKVIGKLPCEIECDLIETHLESASRELERWIGEYSDSDEKKRADCFEAECCLAIAYLLPTLNTFYTEGVTTLSKEVGQVDFQFHNPQQVGVIAKTWIERAERCVAAYRDIGMVAI